MNKITVSASRQYDVVIGKDLLSNIAKYVNQISAAKKIAIISDSNVWPLYGNIMCDSLSANGYEHCHYTFTVGEAQKNGNTYLDILNFLAENNITRTDLIIALGGGVVGDLTGFAAATFLRGVTYVQVPTSLLAMVDSSVGGKTAIDLPSGKNLAGTFYQPSLVLCDIYTLSTLPTSTFIDGCAEVIKYGVLYDPDLFAHLVENTVNFDREYVISRCVELKKNVVLADEFDKGERQKLNLGHTIVHAVERNSNFTITHGQAVSIGMNIVAKSAARLNLCSQNIPEQIQSLTKNFGLPTETNNTADQLFNSALSDKKRSGGIVNMILPKVIGECIIYPLPVEQLKGFIEAGL